MADAEKSVTSTSAGESSPLKSVQKTTPQKEPRPRNEKKLSVQIAEPTQADLERQGYTVVKIEEKHGPLHQAIPCMPLPLAIICCVLNIVAPGVGTLISSFTVFCCGSTRLGAPWKAFGLNILSAFLQMLTFLVIVGWIWSILWGMTFVQLAWEARTGESAQFY